MVANPSRPKYAGLKRRLAAFLVDAVLNFAAFLLAAMIASALLPVETDRDKDPAAAWDRLGAQSRLAVVIAYFVSLGALYVPLCHSSPAQATLGKAIAKIYVVGQDGTRLSFARAFWRWLAEILLAPFGIGLISVVTIVADSKHRAVHDFAAGTVVELNPLSNNRPSLEWWRIVVGIGVQVMWVAITFAITFAIGFGVV